MECRFQLLQAQPPVTVDLAKVYLMTVSPTDRSLAALPMHLMLAMQPWLALRSVSQLSSEQFQGLQTSLHNLPNPGELGVLWQRILSDKNLRNAAESEAKDRLTSFLQGVVRYKETPYTRNVAEFPAVFTKGSSRLLDCGGKQGAPLVLLVPSLINRYYVLDLTPELSFARYLKAQGMHVYIVDWGVPGETEQGYNCASYVSEHLATMAEWIKRSEDEHLTLAGYCMGGLLTLALACARPDLVDALACFATPWDYSVPDFPRIALPEHEVVNMRKYIAAHETLPAEAIHTLFHLANPYAFQAKLRDFQRMKAGGREMQDFLAIEQWVQDGVPMTRGVAEDCLIAWGQQNHTATLQWRACGRVVNPSHLAIPVFIAAPTEDRIVPTSSALPLAKLCRNATVVQPASGHVSMVVGKHRKSALWEPFASWLKAQTA